MNKELFKKIKKEIGSVDISEQELDEEIGRVVYAWGDIETDMKDLIRYVASGVLERASEAQNYKEAAKYAKEAYKICPECLDAAIAQSQFEIDLIKQWEILNKGLESERKRLEKEEYFEEDNIGIFYGLLETRPYIRGLRAKLDYYIMDGKMKKAMETCKEILHLNNNDNLGVRYVLMALYAYFEEEKPLLNLHKKYQEKNLQTLFPLFALYYKLEDKEKAIKYLKEINSANKEFINYYKGTMKEDKHIMPGYYSLGGSSEVEMYMREYAFLVDSMPLLDDYLLDMAKEIKPKKKLK